MLSQVLTASYSGRIDSSFFLKEYLNNQSFEFPYALNQIARIKSGTTPADRDDDLKEGVMLLKTNNIRNNILNKYSDIDYFINEEVNERMKSSEVKEHDILVNIVGATLDVIGRVSYVTNSLPKSNITQAMSFVRLKKEYEKTFIPAYLFIFLQSKFGKIQLNRHARPTGQYNLNNEELGSIRVFNLDILEQKDIEKLVNISLSRLIESNQFYQTAQTLLLEHLDLKDFNPPAQTVNIKSFADSFGTSGRLDAEFYQEKYDLLEDKLSKFPRIKLCDFVDYPISSGITPKAGGDDYTDKASGIPFIRAVDLENGRVSLDNVNYITPDVHNKTLKRTKLKQGDILLSIAGTVGRAALFNYDIEANINQAVAIIRSNKKDLLTDYLVLFFNSSAGKEYTSKYARQGLQTNLNLAEVGDLSIPIISMEIQSQIADLIRQSDRLRQESQSLLEEAKRKVEEAIEG